MDDNIYHEVAELRKRVDALEKLGDRVEYPSPERPATDQKVDQSLVGFQNHLNATRRSFYEEIDRIKGTLSNMEDFIGSAQVKDASDGDYIVWKDGRLIGTPAKRVKLDGCEPGLFFWDGGKTTTVPNVLSNAFAGEVPVNHEGQIFYTGDGLFVSSVHEVEARRSFSPEDFISVEGAYEVSMEAKSDFISLFVADSRVSLSSNTQPLQVEVEVGDDRFDIRTAGRPLYASNKCRFADKIKFRTFDKPVSGYITVVIRFIKIANA